MYNENFENFRVLLAFIAFLVIASTVYDITGLYRNITSKWKGIDSYVTAYNKKIYVLYTLYKYTVCNTIYVNVTQIVFSVFKIPTFDTFMVNKSRDYIAPVCTYTVYINVLIN